MEEGKNLRGKNDKLVYYRLKDTEKYEERQMLIEVKNEETKKTYYYPVKDKIIFSEDEVRKFSLDKYGEDIPYIDGQLTIFNNYFFDFWGYYLTAEGTTLYAHLKRYAYGDKDYCYPNLELIAAKMDKSRKTLLNYIDILERYGFIYQFGVLNQSRNMMEESSLYKVRKKTPLLSKKLIYGDPNIVIPEDAPPHIKKALKKEQKGLPEELRKEHKKFVEKYIENDSKIELEEVIDYEKIYQAWERYGNILKKNRRGNKKVVSRLQTSIEYVMNDEEKLILNFLLDDVKQKMSKPSYETWFSNLSVKLERNTIIIYTPNEFARQWLQEQYFDLIKESIDKLDTLNIENILIEEVSHN